MTKTLPALALLLALTACGGGASSSTGAKTSPTLSPQQVAAKVGCLHWHNDSQQMFTRSAGHCYGVRGLYEVASFNDTAARDNWLDAAQGMGGVYLYGDLWVVAANTPAAAKVAQSKVGGDIR